ncbi:MAG: ECF transporter S component [Oscillospiraceae bacterium]|nr:ECF transporter S component [Oscillospiraceae bacterium]
MTTTRSNVYRLVLAALFVALGLVMPFLTGQIPQFGSMLLPMHLPVLLCGFVLGWKYGLAVGALVPILRSVCFGMPPMYPTAVSMMFELAAYGLLCGLLYQLLPKKVINIYVSLIGAMLGGRVVWGVVRWLMMAGGVEFGWQAFIAGAFVQAVPGILVQIVLIPLLVLVLEKSKVLRKI